MKACSEAGCSRPFRARGYCVYHYTLKRDSGQLELKHPTVEGRIFGHVEVTGFCWLWRSTINKGGYGTTSIGSKHWLAHRWIYEHLVGTIPDGLHLDHLCRIRHCVNPCHLEPVTTQENLRRGLLGLELTHCRHGHELSGDNLFIEKRPKNKFVKRCKVCHNKKVRKYKEKQNPS